MKIISRIVLGVPFVLGVQSATALAENASTSGAAVSSVNAVPNCATVNVTAVSPAGISYPAPATIPTTPGQRYRLTVSGTYFANDGLYADAKYSSRFGSAWSDIPQNHEQFGAALLELQVWDPTLSSYITPNWGPYSPAHAYSTEWVATGSSLTFRIGDFAAENNSGSLAVTACPVQPACTTVDVTAVSPVGVAYPVAAMIPAVPGRRYQLTVRGTYFANDGLYADAKYSSRFGSAWSDVPQNYEGSGPTLLDMQVWDPTTASFISPNWGSYAPDHTYSAEWVATSSALSFRIADSYAGNNSGFLSVSACQVNW